MKPIVIGTRQSELALRQTEWVAAQLGRHTDRPFQLHKVVTKGDRILNVTLSKVGGKGLFVKEIEEALLSGQIDLAVHSLKDMPAQLPPGLTLGAILRREDPRDCLIAKGGLKLEELPSGAKVGTSSLRRTAQLLAIRPDLQVVPLRGNINTRLRKLEESDLDAIVLAAAGLQRMGWEDKVSQYLDVDRFLPAVGQGALCVECRADDEEMLGLLQHIHEEELAACVTAERAFLETMEGGCQVPIGGYAQWVGEEIHLSGFVAAPSGRPLLREEISGRDAVQLGRELGHRLMERGALGILSAVGEENSHGRR